MLWGMLSAVVVSLFMGKLFVKWALRDLHHLAHKVEQMDIDSLTLVHEMDHLPEYDEIHIVADALQRMSDNVRGQVDDMKQFVSNVSHELRTPLMILRSTNELAVKTQAYAPAIDKNIMTITQMEQLISTLLLLARTQHEYSEKELVNLARVI